MLHIENRLKKLREKMIQKNLDAVLVTKRENYFYLSGFTGTSANLIITKDEALLVTDFRYVEQAEKQSPDFQVIKYSGTLSDFVSNILLDRNIKTLGFEEMAIPFGRLMEYKEKLGNMELVPLNGILENLRIIKDQEEINTIKKAVEIADNAYAYILKFIKPGMAEIEVAAEIEYFMRKQGAASASFDIIVASGKRAAMPHGVASEKKLEFGDVVTLDYGALYKGYCSDITRTFFLGKADEELRNIYSIVLEAQQKSLEKAAKGMKGSEVDYIARDIITKAGYGENFGHGLGHGVGLEIHEEPRFSPYAGNTEMENGMVVTVEPGIYITGLGGVRIEDMIVINDNSPIVLTGATKEMIIL
ncbi:MAG TPA: aminopeptidase P family protein [Clostridiaceae bacterium]|nr:aminopeptidase P family protein [Clostridiaceae bacterium]